MKTILVGVCGGIASYKAIEIVNALCKKDYDVHVIMTKNATEFIGPLTFQSLSHNPVVTDMFNPIDKWDTKHIQLAKKADLFLIVPATANIIGKIACGIADDMMTTTIMATTAPVIIAPAMNTNMWENPILKDNIHKLSAYGYRVLETEQGHLACGDIGRGKLLDWQDIIKIVESSLQ
ncbi:bifunctional phosphopantothenoylcysteine decarboxylase/phosphopantothenate--cysteine ligase CoaBC [Petrocella sp. FN5]|uniref:bifunctional phosphopantothenoylcysteine decarboxylase/phosphopantothenate--cysteine ligase CoaBC n=1 Tax=Petrocella sp. FN5 TaxID=3032002 RepID=UPI002ECFC2F1